MPLRHAEAGGDGLDGLAGINQGRHGDEFVRRVHGGADRVLHQRRLEGLALGLDQARHLEVVGDDALGGKLLQDLEPPPAGGDGVDALLVGRGVDDQVLLYAPGLDACLQFGLRGGRGRGLADIAGGQDELVQGNVLDGG